MKILNFGSLNFDKVYDVSSFVTAGETVSAKNYSENIGGKGLNQSIALANAGAYVFHFGAVGVDGEKLLSALKQNNVNTDFILHKDGASGHAIIQTSNGENCIIVEGGANRKIPKSEIDYVISNFDNGDLLIVQNEVSYADYAIKTAKKHGLKVAFNPSPIDKNISVDTVSLADFIIVNEIEAAALAETETDDFDLLSEKLSAKFPNSAIVLTLGKDGVIYKDEKTTLKQSAFVVDVVDTTAAGDTFAGYFIAGVAENFPLQECLKLASKADAITVSKNGASASIPTKNDVLEILL